MADYKKLDEDMYSLLINVNKNVAQLETKFEHFEKWSENTNESIRLLAETIREVSERSLTQNKEEILNMSTKIAVLEEQIKQMKEVDNDVSRLSSLADKAKGVWAFISLIGVGGVGALLNYLMNHKP